MSASTMAAQRPASSSRDPYRQGSVRRESIDHPESKQAIEDERSVCHMPAVRMSDRDRGLHTNVFSRFPLAEFPTGDKVAADGAVLRGGCG